MSPKRCRTPATTRHGLEVRHSHRIRLPYPYQHEYVHSYRHRDGQSYLYQQEQTSNKFKLELEEEEANKSIYICYLEDSKGSVAYVIRAIRLADLLSSENPSRLRKVGFLAGNHLPGSVGSGVMGSQILLAGGLTPNIPYGIVADKLPSPVLHKNVYAFETDPNKQQQSHATTIRRLDASLQDAKLRPMMVEIGGKMYALSSQLVVNSSSFEVFDPKLATWSGLPQPPFFQPRSKYFGKRGLSYAIVGTKIFVSHRRCPVFCYDVAHPDREWRLVPTMSEFGDGRPFPFDFMSLVLDLPVPNKKIVFAYSHKRWCLGVYIMSLRENQESIIQIGDLKLPQLPHELGEAARLQFVHIGGRKACIVVPKLQPSFDEQVVVPKRELGSHKTWGVVIPFQFEVDITKLGRDRKNCFTVQFSHIRIFKFYTTPSTLPNPEAALRLKRQLKNEASITKITAGDDAASTLDCGSIVSRLKSEAAEAHAEFLEAEVMKLKWKQHSGSFRTDPYLFDADGRAFWKLKGYNDGDDLLVATSRFGNT